MYFVTAYVRSPKKIGEVHERLKVMQGDVFNAAEMAGSMEGHDALFLPSDRTHCFLPPSGVTSDGP